jgi:phosphoglycerate kinase
MAKLSIKDLELEGSRVFVRVDFNVPIAGDRVGDDLRIREALPTLRYALERGATLILASHLGRPKGKADPKYSLAPVARRLAELLGREVRFVPECVGPEVENAVAAAAPGAVLLLENLRFHPEEEANDPRFAKKLARLAPLYVDDAFGSAHRAHASTEGITHYVERAAAGLLMERELRYLGDALENPARPFTAILGGAKVSDKIPVIENLLPKVDHLLIGGAMMFTFLKGQGGRIGRSLVEEDQVELTRALVERAGARLLLPSDAVVSPGRDDAAAAHVVPASAVPDAEMGLDVGPATVARYAEVIRGSRTVVWNGPMGVFEVEAFAAGTLGVARAVADSGALSIVGGGDSAAALAKAGLADRITHISTGGGASLEFLAGDTLPGVAALSERP